LQVKTMVEALVRNNVRVLGKGRRTLVFGHGFGCDQTMWRHVYPAFLDDFRVILFDYVGAGNSDSESFDRRRYSTLHGYAQDLIEILGELELDGVHFVGHSVSSMIGALAAIRRPELFSTLTMVSPSPCYINDGAYKGGFDRSDIDELLNILESNQVAWAATLAPLIMGNPQSPELTEELQGSFCKLDPAIANHFARVTFLSDNRIDLPLVLTKTLLLQSKDDAISNISVGEYVHSQLPSSEFIVMDTVGHCSHMSAPAQVVQHLKRFLEEDGERPSSSPTL
jgi:sigma-B regulation protein RsbQ